MKTPRIEERDDNGVRKPHRIKVGDEWFVPETNLTEAHQAGIDEAVEKIKSKRKTKNSIKHFGGMGYYNQQGYNQALDDTIKALQDNK